MQEGYNEENECRTVQENFYVGSLEVGEQTPQHFLVLHRVNDNRRVKVGISEVSRASGNHRAIAHLAPGRAVSCCR